MKIPFEKFSSYGNNFVIIDETRKEYIPEFKKSNFAKNITDVNFGIGADGFIVIQPCNPEVFLKINSTFSYWPSTSCSYEADYIFRMFEPDGTEALCCGNGLMSLAYYLYKTKGITFSRILTEIPNNKPVIRTIGYNIKKQEAWVDMGTPGRIPPFLFNPENMTQCDNNIYRAHFNIPLNHVPCVAPSMKQTFSLTGYLIFTGEPHLVFLLASKKYNNNSFAAKIFINGGHINHKNDKNTIKSNIAPSGTDFIYAMGRYFNHNLRDVFPCGINLNFINYLKDSNVIEQRCFERGIEKETLACGTGMVASAYLLHTLHITDNNTLCIYPVTCRSYKPDAQIRIEIRQNKYLLNGIPLRICTGYSFFF